MPLKRISAISVLLISLLLTLTARADLSQVCDPLLGAVGRVFGFKAKKSAKPPPLSREQMLAEIRKSPQQLLAGLPTTTDRVRAAVKNLSFMEGYSAEAKTNRIESLLEWIRKNTPVGGFGFNYAKGDTTLGRLYLGPEGKAIRVDPEGRVFLADGLNDYWNTGDYEKAARIATWNEVRNLSK